MKELEVKMATLTLPKVAILYKLRNKYLPSLIFVRSRFKRPDTPEPDPEIVEKTWPERPHMEREYFVEEFDLERPKGKIYDKNPFKIELEAGKLYAWCSCGVSRNQPFCDGSHKSMDTARFVKTKMTKKFRPIRFKVEETKEYWLCNCKQTENSPYCDLTHRRQDIQDFIKS